MFRRGKSRKRRAFDPVSLLRSVIMTSIAALIVLPYVGDAAQGILKNPGEPKACRIVNVVDGDTVGMLCPSSTGLERARLTGFDTPELFKPSCGQEFLKAVEAKWKLRALIWTAEDISIVKRGTDRYGRRLIWVGRDGRPIAEAMIASGLARPYDGGQRRGWCGA